MVSALAAAHSAGVIHRKFKTSSVVLLDPEPGAVARRVVVTDFGAAEGSGELTPACDITALGLVIYQLVTGHIPSAGAGATDLLQRLDGSGADGKWKSVILRCLERHPASRFAKVEDVLEGLGGLRLTDVEPFGRRNRLLVAVAAGAAF